jgi:hypothetical protein
MMLVRKRPTNNIFEVSNLRSSTSIQVINNMMALCEQEREVEFRSGLGPEKCCYFKDDDSKLKLEKGYDSYD